MEKYSTTIGLCQTHHQRTKEASGMLKEAFHTRDEIPGAFMLLILSSLIATLRARPRGRVGRVGAGKGCVRGRPRGRFGTVRSGPVALRGRPRRFGSTQGAGATLKLSSSETLQM